MAGLILGSSMLASAFGMTSCDKISDKSRRVLRFKNHSKHPAFFCIFVNLLNQMVQNIDTQISKVVQVGLFVALAVRSLSSIVGSILP